MDNDITESLKEALQAIAREGGRTNILRKYEQNSLAYFVQRMPRWVTSNMLTAFGMVGSLIIFSSFVLAKYVSEIWLLLGVLGFMINWFGDSLDGRLAYYRNTPRKWYGFSLDLTSDWISTILMGWGYLIYVDGIWELLGFAFVVMYGWAMITTLTRYKVTGKYSIDSGFMGPTEVRIVISIMLILEVLITGSIIYSSGLACLILLIINIADSLKLLKLANVLDKEENEKRAGNGAH